MGHTLKVLRESADVSVEAVAERAGRGSKTIRFLESGKNPLPPEVDYYFAVYADVTGLNDSRLIWEAATKAFIERGKRTGLPPWARPPKKRSEAEVRAALEEWVSKGEAERLAEEAT